MAHMGCRRFNLLTKSPDQCRGYVESTGDAIGFGL